MPLAPIAIFVFKRPELTRGLLASLRANPEADRTEVHVFADAARRDDEVAAVEATRAAVRESKLQCLRIVERERNMGLARSVVDGVSRLCSEHGRVIVLEDDLVVSRAFLAYANAGLDRYRDDERVMHVSGYQYDLDLRSPGDALFLPFISSWGWATWDRAWRHFDPLATAAASVLGDPAVRRRFDLDGTYRFSAMLEGQLAGRLDSWAIRWYLSVFARGGLSLFPARSLVENAGVGPGATHTGGDEDSALFRSRAHDLAPQALPDVEVDLDSLRRLQRLFARERSLPLRAARRLRRLWRRLAR